MTVSRLTVYKLVFPGLFFVSTFFFLGYLLQASQREMVLSSTAAAPAAAGGEVSPTSFSPLAGKPLPGELGITARSVLVVDIDSGLELFGKEPDQKLLPASTTKIMTALVALDYYPLDQVLIISNQEVEGNNISLLPGQRWTVEDLLAALLIASGNDAAQALAENYPGGVRAFVQAMNQRANAAGLKQTNFTNPAGYDEPNHYSTARDLATLTVQALQNPTLAYLVALPGITITDADKKVSIYLKNTNELVGKEPLYRGVKTGWTENAGECLIALLARDGRRVLTVVLGSQDRFGDTDKLTKLVFAD